MNILSQRGQKRCRIAPVRKIAVRGGKSGRMAAYIAYWRGEKIKIRLFQRIFRYLSVFSRKIIPSFSDLIELD